ncbi:LPXTG cell wall anchor domain-containing protein [Pseudactinotalea sp. HY160]|uniref:GH92 family glycosyl hydrolase n=1 Tax=Pseudactinotalea sp. HY160 TaxID=2654490 RepID=UPI00128D9DB9|nr:GH92 family glycosyl hydrolase [Pseudactinotalea sp. HY160]MPV50225.1 LPXTG cell wall anchor domain-containing protein [Pseudactinotalea sp. HY160]
MSLPRSRTTRAGGPRRRAGAAAAVASTGALVGTLLIGATVPAAAAESEFASSFEAGDSQPALSASYDAPVNFTGASYRAGSLLGLVAGVTASDENPPSETAVKAADGNPKTKWLAHATSAWLTYELSEAASITGYALTSANDAPDRDPRDFTVEGSTDGEDWVELDARTGEVWQDDDGENRFVTKDYELDERSAEYTYVRLNIAANQGTSLIQLADFELLDSDLGTPITPMLTEVAGGPSSSSTAKTGVGFTGTRSLHYGGQVTGDGGASAVNTLFETDVELTADSQLTYKIFPELDRGLTYASTHAAVDLVFDDGTRLSETGATDAYGFGANARAQGTGNILWPDQWNSVTVDLSAFAGRTVTDVLLAYDQPDAPAGTTVGGYLDDVTLDHAVERDTSDGLVSYVDTRRGTNSSGGFSRGNNIPATAWPNGFNFITPFTNASTTGTLYEYQARNNSDNRPTLEGIGFSHEPSIWMGDRNQFVVLPADGSDPTSKLSERKLAFGHENETARPDIYEVEFDNGLATAVTPTDHGAVFAFTFTGDTGSVLVDQGISDKDGKSGLTVSADGHVSGWVEDGSSYPGKTRMFVAGQFDAAPTAAGAAPRGDRDSARYAAFDTSEDSTVELRVASSFISQAQAEKNLGLEVTGRSFDELHAAATDAWNERLSVITDVEGATDEQLVNLYSGLYRLNLYPNSQFENTGTAEAPVYQYASPVSPTVGDATDTETNAPIVDGKIYVNNGFWDTYRTAWPAYALLYPDGITQELVDGFVQQYRDGGWVARWSSPGYADLMTGTSSDVAFAEAYLAGAIDTDLALDAYDAAVKNATVLPDSNAVGRKGLDRSIFLGYTDASTHQSASWGLEGFINDYGIAQMAHKLADDPNTPADRVAQLREEAAYFDARSEHFALMYNPEAGVFTSRNADGSFSDGADFDKKEWGGAFTEASGWTFAFHAPQDVDGLAALYGGRQGLVDELHEFLTTPEKADYSGIHEAREARDVRLGMLGLSNQVAHHIPYVLAEAGDPSGAQELIREIMQRLFAGSDIGQGYPGDEDNGEFSAWYIFSALGFYPLQVGSGDYTIGSPIFDAATLNLGDTTLRIEAPGASEGKVYVDGVAHNGTPLTETTIDGDLIRSGGTLTFTMSESPSDWGAKDLDEDLSVPETMRDATKPGVGTLTARDGAGETVDSAPLTDDLMRSSVTFEGTDAELIWTSESGPVAVHSYTLTATTAGAAPAAWTLEASSDGENWTELDSRSGETFPFGTQTRPFSVPGSDNAAGYTQYRLTVSAAEGDLALAELELFATGAATGDLEVTGADAQRVRMGEEFDGQVATIRGEGVNADSDVTVDFGDGGDAQPATLTDNGFGGWRAAASHTYDRPGVYTVTVTATADGGARAGGTTSIEVYRDDTFTGQFNNVCIGDLNETAGNCDGQSSSYFRDKLADSGFVQGTTVEVPGTDVTFDLPDIPAGEPDNITGEGQSVAIDLGDGATQISLIGTATESGKDLTGVLTYADGTTQDLPIQFGDWVGASGSPAYGNILVGLSKGRLVGTQAEGTVKNSGIFATAPVDLATDSGGAAKRVVSLTLPVEEGTLRNDGRAHLFAIASDGDRQESAALAVSPAEVGEQTTQVAFTEALATVSGGVGTDDADGATAVVNWGDGSAVDLIDAVTDSVTGTHTYAAPGTYQVAVTVDDGVTSQVARLEIVVTDPPVLYEPAITLDAETVAPGGTVGVTGSGFAPGETVAVDLGEAMTLAGAEGGEGTVTADADGGFAYELAIPADAVAGTYPVVATGAESQVPARAEIVVALEVPGPVDTSVTLTAGSDAPVAGSSVTLTATVAPAEASGMIEILDGDEVVGTAPVSGGTASVDVTPATSGEHSYTARFTPDDEDAFVPSTSAALVLTVGDAPIGGDDGGSDGGSDGSDAGSDQGDDSGSSDASGADTAADGSGDGSMPSTGASVTGWVIALGALLAAGGLVIALRRRFGSTAE